MAKSNSKSLNQTKQFMLQQLMLLFQAAELILLSYIDDERSHVKDDVCIDCPFCGQDNVYCRTCPLN